MHVRPSSLMAIAVTAVLAFGGSTLAQSPAASVTPSTVDATWTKATYPVTDQRQTPGPLWSDGRITLSSAWRLRAVPRRDRRDWRQVIWASADGGATWQRADVRDADGHQYTSGNGSWLDFTHAGDSYYAIPQGQLRSVPEGQPVLRSADGLKWQVVGDRTLPDDADMYAVASTGLVAAGGVGPVDAGGLYDRVWRTGRRTTRIHQEKVVSSPAILTSTDGVTWRISATLPIDASEQGIATWPIVRDDGSMLVLGEVMTSERDRHSAMWRSTDGITFERVTTGPMAIAGATWHDAATASGVRDGSYFLQTYTDLPGTDVLDDMDQGTVPTTIWTSPDGISWTQHDAPAGVGLLGAIATDDGILSLVEAREGSLAGRLLTPEGDWLDVPGRPFAIHPSGVSSGPDTVAVLGQRNGQPRDRDSVIVVGTIHVGPVSGSPTPSTLPAP